MFEFLTRVAIVVPFPKSTVQDLYIALKNKATLNKMWREQKMPWHGPGFRELKHFRIGFMFQTRKLPLGSDTWMQSTICCVPQSDDPTIHSTSSLKGPVVLQQCSATAALVAERQQSEFTLTQEIMFFEKMSIFASYYTDAIPRC